jgi:hypothetical protein
MRVMVPLDRGVLEGVAKALRDADAHVLDGHLASHMEMAAEGLEMLASSAEGLVLFPDSRTAPGAMVPVELGLSVEAVEGEPFRLSWEGRSERGVAVRPRR